MFKFFFLFCCSYSFWKICNECLASGLLFITISVKQCEKPYVHSYGKTSLWINYRLWLPLALYMFWYLFGILWHWFYRNPHGRPQLALTLKGHRCVKLQDVCAVGMSGFTLIETRLRVDCPWNCLILTWLPAVMAPLSVITIHPQHIHMHMHTHDMNLLFFLW